MSCHPFIKRLIEWLKMDPNADFPNEGQCEFCNQRDATCYCTNCDQIFCDDCQRGHKKQKHSLAHQFIPLHQYDPRVKVMTCTVHDKAKLDRYCQSCQDTACEQCLQRKHKNHDVFILDVASPLIKTDLTHSNQKVLLFPSLH